MSLFSAMADEGSVWAQGSSLFNISSPLNDLLEKDDFTLEEVLQEDELVQEVKTRNTKLLDFLSQDVNVQKLVEYVVRTPEDPSDDLRTLKYPYMACEVVCCDIMSITETLVSAREGQIVETLFEFLYTTESLDPRLAGYFEKIMTMLMVRKPQEMTALMNKNSDKLLAGFTRHAASFSISELLKRLLQPYQSDYMDDCMDFPGMSMGFPPSNSWYGQDDDDVMGGDGTPTSSAQKSLSWQSEPTVVDQLLANLEATDADSDVHKHSSEVLVDIIHCGTRAQQNDPASPSSVSTPVSFALLEHLETKAVAEKLVTLAIPANDGATFCSSSMTGALSVLSALLSRATNAQYNAADEMPPAVACVVERLPQLCATLRVDNGADAGTIQNQKHEEVPRLGLRRLKLVGLLVLLMQSKYQKVDVAILEEKAIDLCLDLFFKFELVNMLHADVESMVIGILESGSHELLVGLVKEARLLSRILEAHEKNDEATKERKGFSLGYMGHLHRICNMLMSLLDDVRGSTTEEGSLNEMRHADTVLELFEADEATWKKWEELSTNVLAPIYERERLPLGGVNISTGSEDPYSVMGFNQSDELLNAQFAEMLGASGFGADANGFDTDFDIKDNDTPMLPEIMNDSSSSEEEDEDELARQESELKNGTDGGGVGTDRWANFESAGNWAKFEEAAMADHFDDIPFDTTPLDDSDFAVEPVPPPVTTADLAPPAPAAVEPETPAAATEKPAEAAAPAAAETVAESTTEAKAEEVEAKETAKAETAAKESEESSAASSSEAPTSSEATAVEVKQEESPAEAKTEEAAAAPAEPAAKD